VAARGRELLLGQELSHSHEDQLSLLEADEPHSAKSHANVPIGVVSNDDLIRRQGHTKAVWEEHERTRWSVADDAQDRRSVQLAMQGRLRREVD
jgi:hypothetical protein